ncbi:MAG: amidohydrolase [Nocardioidaceae bacterium]
MTPEHAGVDQRIAADLVLYNGLVHTMDELGRSHRAIAVRDGRVVATGSDREMVGLSGERTAFEDLGGQAAVPGFIETHNHPTFFGMTLSAPVDAGCPPNDTIADIVDRVREATKAFPPGSWIRGYRYDDTQLTDDRHPTRDDLDAASPDHPVCLMHISGHFCSLNSAGLRAVGIDDGTPDPDGGVIVRDERGTPTGVLAETAAFAAYAAMPSDSALDLVSALERAGDAYLEAGVTTVHDLGVGLMAGADELVAYRLALQGDRFRTRVQGFLVPDLLPGLADGDPAPLEQGIAGLGDDRFRVAGAKLWADGSIQGLTGCVSEGYACAPDQHGMLIYQPDELTRRVAALHAAGLQVAVHGNGDAAIETILDAYRTLGDDDSLRTRRHRIEHCQMVGDRQLERMSASGLLASFFIKHVYYWGDRHRSRFLGERRAARLNPLRSALRHGIRFGLHSDTPVVSVPPLDGIRCAVRRRTRDGDVLGPDERIGAVEAVRAYTSEAAHLAFEESRKGTLEPGKLADVAVLSADPLATDADDGDSLDEVHVTMTVIGGDIVWRR